jgi:hypothetical protein
VPADGQTYVVVKRVVVTTPPGVEVVVAYGHTTVVSVVTTVTTPPAVWVPEVRGVEVAAQTVVSSVTVMVVAGMVYVPGVGQVVTNGVGTTTTVLVEGAIEVVVGGGGGGAEVEVETEMVAGVGAGACVGHTRIKKCQFTLVVPRGVLPLTGLAGPGVVDGGAATGWLNTRCRQVGRQTSLQMESLVVVTTASMVASTDSSRNRRSDSKSPNLHIP